MICPTVKPQTHSSTPQAAGGEVVTRARDRYEDFCSLLGRNNEAHEMGDQSEHVYDYLQEEAENAWSAMTPDEQHRSTLYRSRIYSAAL